MARTTHQLTAIKVASLKGTGLYPDGNGLYLRITATGTKGWIFRYTVDGKARDMGLGPLAVVSLAKARAAADECRRQRREGLNPIEARKARKAVQASTEAHSPTFKTCAEQLIASHEVGKHPVSTAGGMRRGQAACAFCSRAAFQHHGSSSSMRLAG